MVPRTKCNGLRTSCRITWQTSQMIQMLLASAWITSKFQTFFFRRRDSLLWKVMKPWNFFWGVEALPTCFFFYVYEYEGTGWILCDQKSFAGSFRGDRGQAEASPEKRFFCRDKRNHSFISHHSLSWCAAFFPRALYPFWLLSMAKE